MEKILRTIKLEDLKTEKMQNFLTEIEAIDITDKLRSKKYPFDGWLQMADWFQDNSEQSGNAYFQVDRKLDLGPSKKIYSKWQKQNPHTPGSYISYVLWHVCQELRKPENWDFHIRRVGEFPGRHFIINNPEVHVPVYIPATQNKSETIGVVVLKPYKIQNLKEFQILYSEKLKSVLSGQSLATENSGAAFAFAHFVGFPQVDGNVTGIISHMFPKDLWSGKIDLQFLSILKEKYFLDKLLKKINLNRKTILTRHIISTSVKAHHGFIINPTRLVRFITNIENILNTRTIEYAKNYETLFANNT